MPVAGNDTEADVAGSHMAKTEQGATGEDGAEAGHGHAPPSAAVKLQTEAYAVSLMGAVLVVMVTFYLVNSLDTDIKLATWQVLNMTVSIFCAVMLYGTTMGGIQYLTGLHSEQEHTFLNLGLFLILYPVFSSILFLLMRSDEDALMLKAVGTIAAHITGFSAMYCGAGILALPIVEVSEARMLLAVVVIASVLLVMSWAAAVLRRQAALADDGIISKEEHEWMEVVADIENDVFSLCLGFALMQIIRRCITGGSHPFEAHHAPLSVTQTETNILLGCSVSLIFVTIGLAWVAKRLRRQRSAFRRLFDRIRDTCSATMAWSLLFWGEWQVYIWDVGSIRIQSLLALGLCMSALAFLLIFVLDYIADHSKDISHELRMVIFSLGLLVGFSWERAFDLTFSEFARHHNSGAKDIAGQLLPVLCTAIIVPAWAMYILPNAEGPKYGEMMTVTSTTAV